MNAKSKTTPSVWVDPDDAPELTDEWFEHADLYHGDKLIRRGRPKADAPKIQTAIRFDQDVLAGLRATGKGWQTRVNDVMREWLKQHSA